MAESELKLEIPCPWCGTSNVPSALRCRQCFQDLVSSQSSARPASEPGLFEMARPASTCPACGHTNLLNGTHCIECGESIPSSAEANMSKTTRLAAARSRRRSKLLLEILGWLKLAWLLRLSSVLFLFWGIVDTSTWLTNVTSGLAPDDAAALRYSIFALFELVRNLSLVAGVWLLTMLSPKPRT